MKLTFAMVILAAAPAFANVEVFPSMVHFRDTEVSLRSNSQSVTITNRGTKDLASVQVSQSCGGNFEVRSGCFGFVRANQSCSLEISFTPKRDGPLSCTITVNGGPSNIDTVLVSGRGVKTKHPAP